MTQAPGGLLQLLPSTEYPLKQVIKNLVVLLSNTRAAYNAVFTIVGRFSKLVKFILCMANISAAELAYFLLDLIVCYLGMLKKIIGSHNN